MSTLAKVMREVNWRPAIGDPTAIAWLTMMVYVAAAYLCFRAAKMPRCSDLESEKRQSSAFWYILSVALIALGVNKQLDLQTFFTEVGRGIAKVQGWYHSRTGVQASVIGWIVCAGVAVLVFMMLLIRRALLRQGLALAGIMLLMCFIALKASSFHQVDLILGSRLGALKASSALELGGLILIGLTAVLNIDWNRQLANPKAWEAS